MITRDYTWPRDVTWRAHVTWRDVIGLRDVTWRIIFTECSHVTRIITSRDTRVTSRNRHTWRDVAWRVRDVTWRDSSRRDEFPSLPVPVSMQHSWHVKLILSYGYVIFMLYFSQYSLIIFFVGKRKFWKFIFFRIFRN